MGDLEFVLKVGLVGFVDAGGGESRRGVMGDVVVDCDRSSWRN